MLKNIILKRKVIFSFCLSYFLILLLLLLLGIFSYYQTIIIIKKQTIKNNLNILKQCQLKLDQINLDCQRLVTHINNHEILRWRDRENIFSKPNIFQTVELKNKLLLYPMSFLSDHIIRYYIIFKKSKAVFATHFVLSLSSFYKYELRYLDYDLQAWYSLFIDNFYTRQYLPAKTVFINEDKQSVISYLHTIGSASDPNGTILVLIDNNKIYNIFKEIDISDGGFISISMPDGKLLSYLYSPGTKINKNIIFKPETLNDILQTFNESKSIKIQITSEQSRLVYTVVQSKQYLQKQVITIKAIYLAVILFFLLLGVIIALYFAFRNSRPIERLLKIINQYNYEQSPSIGNIFNYIQKFLINITSQNTNLRLELEKQKTIIKNTYLTNLITGNINTQKEIKNIQPYLGLDITGKYYCLILMQIDHYIDEINEEYLNEIQVKKAIIYNTITSLNKSIYILEKDLQQLILLFTSKECNEESLCQEINQFLSLLKERILKKAQIKIQFAIGNPCKDLLDIYNSYEQAKIALNHILYQINKDVIWYKNLMLKTNTIHYPTEIETKLINLTKSGNISEIPVNFEKVYQHNFKNHFLTFRQKSILANMLIATLLKIKSHTSFEDNRIEDEISKLLYLRITEKDINNIFQTIKHVFIQIGAYFHNLKKSHNNELRQQIKEFIDQEFANKNIGLTLVADHFQISEFYLSRFFKEQYGINFHNYLENIRIRYVIEQMKTTNLSLKEIINNAGYNSLTSFGRAFKRTYGISPQKYRETLTIAY